MTIRVSINGTERTIASSDEMFHRGFTPMTSSTPAQRKRRQIGALVYVPGAMGRMQYTICAISTDGLTWKDEDGTERATADILL